MWIITRAGPNVYNTKERITLLYNLEDNAEPINYFPVKLSANIQSFLPRQIRHCTADKSSLPICLSDDSEKVARIILLVAGAGI